MRTQVGNTVHMKKRLAVAGLLLAIHGRSLAGLPDGNAQIRAGKGDSEIVITTTRRLAGAIASLKWHGREFINTTDHGRELQSSCSFDDTPSAGAETFNPTEAGSRRDSAGPNSTSRLLEITARGNHLRTRTQMAFWLAPAERSEGQLARNTNTLSNYVLTKDVSIGFQRWPQVLDYRVTFSVPVDARHVMAQYEALTGYMPPEFDHFWEFNPQTGELLALTHKQGGSPNPVVLATADGQYAMGIFAPPQKLPDTTGPIFARWYFDDARVAKWNCVYRVHNPQGIRDGDYTYRMLVPVGTLKQVTAVLRDWHNLKW